MFLPEMDWYILNLEGRDVHQSMSLQEKHEKHILHDTTGNKKEDGCMSLLVSRSVLGTGRALSV